MDVFDRMVEWGDEHPERRRDAEELLGLALHDPRVEASMNGDPERVIAALESGAPPEWIRTWLAPR